MDVQEDLEERVKARGVRVAERLELLRVLRQHQGVEQLADLMAQHERSIEEAATKVQEVIR
jgi:hypothetical protein